MVRPFFSVYNFIAGIQACRSALNMRTFFPNNFSDHDALTPLAPFPLVLRLISIVQRWPPLACIAVAILSLKTIPWTHLACPELARVIICTG